MGLALSLDTHDDTPADASRLTATARARWPEVLADVQLARLYRGAWKGGPRETHCSIASLQGAAGGAQRDASATQVATMWALLHREGAHRIRAGFVETLERWLDDTTPRNDGDVDWPRARAAAERLVQLPGPDARLLSLLAGELVPGASWESAATLTAEVAAPAALRALWSARTQAERAPGRPRRDVAEPPVEAERAAWGEARLTGAVLAWVETGRTAGGNRCPCP